MAIASRLKWYLDVNRAEYAVGPGEAPGETEVVSDLFQDARGYLMVVHPASRKVALAAIREQTGRPLHPVRPRALRDIFFDCQKGAIPVLGPAYGVPTIVDEALPDSAEVCFRGGDAEDWVHMRGAELQHLVAQAEALPHG
jgi:Ala-tRNA(Pro) deacylase